MVALIALALFSAGNSVPAAAPDAPVKDKTVCKKDRTKDMGTRLSTSRVCKKASEWKQLEEQSRRDHSDSLEREGSVR